MQVPYRLHSEIQEKIIYNQLRKDIQDIIRDLCKWKGVEIIEGHISGISAVGIKPLR